MISSLKASLFLMSFVLASFLSPLAQAEPWPQKPVKIVVPFGAGGDTDFNARLLAKYLEPELGVSLPVINVSGAGGSIGARQVHDAKPDGQTVLFFHSAMLVNTASGLADFSFHDMEIAAIVGREPGGVIVVKADAPWKTIGDLMAASSADPGAIDLTTNIGATTYLIGSMINKAGGGFNFVDLGGSASRLTAVLGGNVDVSQNPLGQILPYVESGELRALATLAAAPNEDLPDVPTFSAAGYEDVQFQYVYFLAFPKKTDPAIVARLSGAAGKVVRGNEAYAQELKKSYRQEPFYLDSKEAAAFLLAEEKVINGFQF